MNKQFNYQLPDIYLYCNPLSNVSRIDAYLCSCVLLVTHTYKRRRESPQITNTYTKLVNICAQAARRRRMNLSNQIQHSIKSVNRNETS